MELEIKKRKSEAKKVIQGMMPIKKWITKEEACGYIGLSRKSFDIVNKEYGFTESTPPEIKIIYYSIESLDKWREKNISRKQPKQ